GRDVGRVGGSRKSTDHFSHLPRGYQGAHIHFSVHCAGVVGDAGQIFGALTIEGSEQVARQADAPKAGGHEDGAIRNVRHGLIKSLIDFIFHWLRLLQDKGAYLYASYTGVWLTTGLRCDMYATTVERRLTMKKRRLSF